MLATTPSVGVERGVRCMPSPPMVVSAAPSNSVAASPPGASGILAATSGLAQAGSRLASPYGSTTNLATVPSQPQLVLASPTKQQVVAQVSSPVRPAGVTGSVASRPYVVTAAQPQPGSGVGPPPMPILGSATPRPSPISQGVLLHVPSAQRSQPLQQQQQAMQQRPGQPQGGQQRPPSPASSRQPVRPGAAASSVAGSTVGGAPQAPVSGSVYEAEVARRTVAEARVRELEGLVSKLRGRIASLQVTVRKNQQQQQQQHQGTGDPNAGGKDASGAIEPQAPDDAIDQAIRAYLESNPDFPVSVQKVAPNNYVFGDRGNVYVTQRGEHIVVRVGGGFKSLQVFMDERALMLTRDAAGAVSEQRAVATQVI